LALGRDGFVNAIGHGPQVLQLVRVAHAGIGQVPNETPGLGEFIEGHLL